MADVWVQHPAGLAVAVHLAIIVAVEVHVVFVRHRKSQKKKPLKKAASARQVPKKETNAAGQQRREAIIAGNMHDEWIFLITYCVLQVFHPDGQKEQTNKHP